MCPLKDLKRWNCSSTNISTFPLQSYWKANENQRLPEAHLTVPNFGQCLWSDQAHPNPLHPWQIELSCTDGRQAASIPLWTPRSAGLGRNSRLIIPVVWSRGRARRGWAEVGAQAGAGGGTGTASARREQQHLLPPDDTYLTAISTSMPRGNELCFKPLEVFLLGLSLTAFFILFYLLDFKFSFRHRNVWVPCQQRRDLCAVQIIVCLCLAQNPSYNIFLTN